MKIIEKYKKNNRYLFKVKQDALDDTIIEIAAIVENDNVLISDVMRPDIVWLVKTSGEEITDCYELHFLFISRSKDLFSSMESFWNLLEFRLRELPEFVEMAIKLMGYNTEYSPGIQHSVVSFGVIDIDKLRATTTNNHGI